MIRMPEKFEKIAEYSDEEYSHEEGGVVSLAEIVPQIMTRIEEERESGQLSPLKTAINELDDQSFREITGWVSFGRSYRLEQGEATEVLQQYIREAVVKPRSAQSGWLEGMPIGEYLRSAVDHLNGNTPFDENEEGDEYEEG